MDELLHQVLTALRGMWRRRWIGLAVAWAVAVIGAVVVLRIPDRYEATARVFVDTQTVLKPLMSGLAVQPNIDEQISMLARTLIARPNIEKIMRSADLDVTTTTQLQKDRMVDDLTSRIKFTGVGRENIYSISYQDVDADRAKRVVQDLLSLFVESGVGNKRRDNEAARRFIDEQIKGYEKKLEEAENRVKEFKIRNVGFSSSGGQDYFTRMSILTEDVQKQRLELRALEESRDALKRELVGEDPVLMSDLGSSSGGPATEFDARIADQTKLLDELMRRYTDQHPDVVATKRLIASLEDQKKQEIEARRKAAAANPGKFSTSTNPVFQKIKISLAETEAGVAALRARVAESEARLAQLKAVAGRAPQVEAEMAQLNRDYDGAPKELRTARVASRIGLDGRGRRQPGPHGRVSHHRSATNLAQGCVPESPCVAASGASPGRRCRNGGQPRCVADPADVPRCTAVAFDVEARRAWDHFTATHSAGDTPAQTGQPCLWRWRREPARAVRIMDDLGRADGASLRSSSVGTIEQAAKRLEQLRKSGVDLTAESGIGQAPIDPASEPLPLRVAKELDARSPEPLIGEAAREPDAVVTPIAAPVSTPTVRAVPPTSAVRPPPSQVHVEIDLARLSANGYVTPHVSAIPTRRGVSGRQATSADQCPRQDGGAGAQCQPHHGFQRAAGRGQDVRLHQPGDESGDGTRYPRFARGCRRNTTGASRASWLARLEGLARLACRAGVCRWSRSYFRRMSIASPSFLRVHPRRSRPNCWRAMR